MKKITNREEANDYYKKINKGVDEFFTKTNARPSEVHKYLTNNKKRFLKQLELDDVDGIESVLNDVVAHRKNLQDDKIITFESFSSLNENFFHLTNPTIDFEKVLADKFHTSLGHIDIVDPQFHLYKINDFGKNIFCVVLSKDDLNLIREFLIRNMKEDISNKVVSIGEVSGVQTSPLKFWISEFIDNNLLTLILDSKLTEPYLLNYFVSILKSSLPSFSNSIPSVSESGSFFVMEFSS